MSNSKLEFRKKALGPFFWLFLLQKLPLAFIAGVKLKRFDDQGISTSMRFNWINQNPFKSMYFAAMQMAAELATGLLLFQYLNKNTRFSMLLLSVKADYHKKAVGKISYTCGHGKQADDFVESMLKTTEGQTILLPVKAINEQGDEVANFEFLWSCKPNKAQN